MSQGIVSQDIADELRKAVVERGAEVYILVPPRLVGQPASYVPALSLLDGVKVGLLEHDEAFAIKNSSETFEIGDTLRPLTTNTSELYNYFLNEWQKATPYRFAPMTRGD
ncbi:MAG: hypothetical protein ACRCYY_16720 [Trueperaceae bacterium]